MTDKLRITLAQLNYTVGDIDGNLSKIEEAYKKACDDDADLVVYSELCVTGYPTEDLVLLEKFQRQAADAIELLAQVTVHKETAMLVGAPWVEDGEIYNAAILLHRGKIICKQYKNDLPNYGVFDEKRLFSAGPLPEPFTFKGVELGILICEDMWNDYTGKSLEGAEILISLSASPYEMGKYGQRRERASKHVFGLDRPLIYMNQFCGHDDLVFDGDSFTMSHRGQEVIRLSRSQEMVETTQWHKGADGIWQCEPGTKITYPSTEMVTYQAMMIGLRDYVTKNKFPGVLVGFSGGIDSALTAAIAVDALGADKVRVVMMPSRFTSAESMQDAAECSAALGLELEQVPIDLLASSFEEALADSFAGTERGLAEENIQARVRGTLLMALSNKHGHMVVPTGNKSEMATGYATLYGDMCGGYSVLKDAYKTQVFDLARWRNSNIPETSQAPNKNVIPHNIITKKPTAELRPDQSDEDSLPPYDVLDKILELLIEEQLSRNAIIKKGFDQAMVEHVYNLLHHAEYKRRQSAPGVKISKRPFSRDRRFPITNGYCG